MSTIPSLLSASLVLTTMLLSFVPATPPASAEPTPGLGCRAAMAGAPLPRIVPEPELALDYLSYDEWRECLTLLNRTAPQYVEIKDLALSVGWPIAGGARLQVPVILVEVTNEASPVPFEHRLKNLFVLSIHGNEKGGREGGFRIIEDLARGIGIAQEYPKLRDYLDFQVEVFVFPNPDGWTHEEVGPFTSNPAQAGGFTRGNANGADLNRQWPNRGWNRESHRAMSQPEIVSTVQALKGYSNWAYGSDIHGMLNPADANTDEYQELRNGRVPHPGGSLLMGMLSAGQADPVKMLKTTRLAELLRERVDADPNFREWNQAPNTGLWGGPVMNWGTSWDSIGYVDSGFTGDFIFQPHGLDAGNIDFELSYNHIVFDNHYVPGGMEMNRLHVRAVRQVVAVFMDAAAADVQVSYETKGVRSAYLFNPKVFTSRDANGTVDPLEGHAASNPNDDGFDYAHVDYEVAPNDFFSIVAPFVRDGDRPGVLDAVQASELSAERLAPYDAFIVAGSAFEQLRGDPAAVAALKTWAEAGGRLVLTDQSLQLLGDLGLVATGQVGVQQAYAGYTNFLDKASPLTAGLRGLARQTYEAVPIGYQPGSAPNWYVEQAAWESAGGKSVGAVELTPPAAAGPVPITSPTPGKLGVNLGELSVGEGQIRILGSLLPDPTEEYYHPYGLDSFATTYTGNLLFRNLLGWEETFDAPPVVLETLGEPKKAVSGSVEIEAGASKESGRDTPGFQAFALLIAAAVLLGARRRAD